MKAIEYAKKHDVPVVLTLGTKYVIADNPAWWQEFLQEHVSILAMNEEEGEALTGFADPLSAANKALDWVDGAVHRRPGGPVYGGLHRRRGEAENPASAAAGGDPGV